MANNIQKAQKYVSLLDEKYSVESKTSVLDTPDNFKYLEDVDTFLVANMDVDGLGDYDRKTGFPMGSVRLNWEPYKADYERGVSYQVDVMDNEESQGLVMLNLANKLYTDKFGPEIDTVRIARYASKEGATKVTEKIEAPEQFLASVRTMKNEWDEKGILPNDRFLFTSPTRINGVMDLDTYKSRAALDGLNIITLPQSRLQTAITLFSGKNGENFGFEIPEESKNINFICIQKDCILQFFKHLTARFFDASVNQVADADLFQYRLLGMHNAFKQKENGIWVSIEED